MIAVVTLSSKHSKRSVFVGALLALAAASAAGVLVGAVLFEYVPRLAVEIVAGALFLAVGLFTLLVPERDGRGPMFLTARYGGFVASFLLVMLMELGDKSQISVIALSAESGEGALVFVGAVAAFALITVLEVLLGGEIGKRVKREYIRYASGAIFLGLGAVILIQVIV